MTIRQLTENIHEFSVINEGDNMDCEINDIFCCDLLSIVMGKALPNCLWVTVMGNANSIAVAVLADIACILLAENAVPDNNMLIKAKDQGVTILSTELPVFKSALKVHELING